MTSENETNINTINISKKWWPVLKQYGVYYSVAITNFFTVMPC